MENSAHVYHCVGSTSSGFSHICGATLPCQPRAHVPVRNIRLRTGNIWPRHLGLAAPHQHQLQDCPGTGWDCGCLHWLQGQWTLNWPPNLPQGRRRSLATLTALSPMARACLPQSPEEAGRCPPTWGKCLRLVGSKERLPIRHTDQLHSPTGLVARINPSTGEKPSAVESTCERWGPLDCQPNLSRRLSNNVICWSLPPDSLPGTTERRFLCRGPGCDGNMPPLTLHQPFCTLAQLRNQLQNVIGVVLTEGLLEIRLAVPHPLCHFCRDQTRHVGDGVQPLTHSRTLDRG